MANRNGLVARVAVILTCVGMLVGAAYLFGATHNDVRHNVQEIQRLNDVNRTTQTTLHRLDKKMERVLTILEQREKERKD